MGQKEKNNSEIMNYELSKVKQEGNKNEEWFKKRGEKENK